MSPIRHIVFSAVPAWGQCFTLINSPHFRPHSCTGHTRPFCILAARLVKENENVVVTMLISPNFLDKAHREISAELQSGDSKVTRQRIRQVLLG